MPDDVLIKYVKLLRSNILRKLDSLIMYKIKMLIDNNTAIETNFRNV